MKSLKRYFCGMVVIIMLSACPSTHVNIAWDAPTKRVDGSPIQSQYELRYNVYISDEGYNDRQCLTKIQPIKETSFKIHHAKENGPYVVGVQAVLFENEVQVNESPSVIAWSNIKKDTKENIFYIDIER